MSLVPSDRVFRWACWAIFLACMIPATAYELWLVFEGRCEHYHPFMAGRIVFLICDK